MKVFLIRHADALDHADDELRPLSPLGHGQAATLGLVLRLRDDFSPAEIWHSSLVRARETAELIVESLGRAVALREMRGLKPEDDPRAMASRLACLTSDLAVVGHEPFLGLLGGILVDGRPGRALLFRKASGYVLEPKGPDDPKWDVRATLEPRVS